LFVNEVVVATKEEKEEENVALCVASIAAQLSGENKDTERVA
jgi:hypothetical protein